MTVEPLVQPRPPTATWPHRTNAFSYLWYLPPMPSHFETLSALVREACAQGIQVVGRPRPSPVRGEFFEPRPRIPAAIWVHKNPQVATYPVPVDEEQALDEAITFAHELGHFLSWKEDPSRYTDAYRATRSRPPAGLSVNEAQLAVIVAEEKRAWRFARERLSHHGFDSWDVFERREAESLEAYSGALNTTST